jgi:hypothetical protein
MIFSLFSQDEEKNKKNKILNQNKIFKKLKDYDERRKQNKWTRIFFIMNSRLDMLFFHVLPFLSLFFCFDWYEKK